MEDYNSKYTGEQVEEFLDQIASGELGGIVSETDPIFSASPAASITDAKKAEWDNKVDKVSGKQLSTEDFTTALKTKLEGLSNYDDTELSEALSTLRGDFDELVSGDTTTAIKTFNEVIAFLDGIQDTQDLSSIIASIEQQIAGKMDKVTLATVATSGSYNDLSNKPTIPAEQVNADWNATSGKAQILNKPTIPSAVTESTVSGWGFTKNTGTYSKPSTGIPKSDLASAVQTSLGKADTALQSYTEQYKGTVTGVKVNGTTKNPSNGVVDLGTVITKHQEISISGDNNSGRPYLFIDTESVDGGLAIGVDATIDIADATEYGELADAYAVQKYVDDEIVHFEANVVEPLDIALGGKANYYIADFAVDDLTNIFYNGGRIENCNKQALGNAISNNSVILIKQSDDNGYCVAMSTYYDSYELSFSVQDGSFNCSVATFMADPSIYQEEVVCQNLASHEYVNAKQDQLVSGTNIKTINGQSLLGSGNITIEGGGGGSSSGSGAYAEVNHGTSDTTLTLTPNTFHVWDEVSSLILTLGNETAGVANEFLFQFTSGATATSLTLPDDIKWTEELVIEANRLYQISILKGLASVLSWDNAPQIVLIQFSVNGATYSAEEGMTWETWVNSSYTNGTSRISGNIVYWQSLYAISGVLPKDTIIANSTYTTYMAD